MDLRIRALLITFVLFIFYPAFREIGVGILHLMNIGVVIYSYSLPFSEVLETILAAAVAVFILVYVYLREGRIKYAAAMAFLLLPAVAIGHIASAVLFLLLALSLRFQLRNAIDVIVAFVFFQWAIATIAVAVPFQSYTYVPENAEKIFVFAHGGYDAFVLENGNEVPLREVVWRNGWYDKCLFMFACNGDEVCENYYRCTYFHEVGDTYIPMFTFFPDIAQGIAAPCPQ